MYQNALPPAAPANSSTQAAGVQVVRTHAEATQNHVTLVDNGHVARGDLDLGSNGLNDTSGFTLEDKSARGIEESAAP